MVVVCLVSLPNGTTFGINCDPKAIGHDCLEKVCKNLDIICETEYFGLVEHKSSGSVATVAGCSPNTNYEWINLRNPLPPSTTNGPLQLELRVKFWVPPHLILQENVRNVVYMQARQDLIDGRLKASNWANSAKMAALLAHADRIRFDAAALTTPTALPMSLPLQVPQSSATPPPSMMIIDVEMAKSTVSPNNNNNAAGDSTAAAAATNTVDRKCKKRRLSRHKSSIDLTPSLAAATIVEPTPLTPYEAYVMRPNDIDPIPDGFLTEIAKEHAKLATLRMSSSSAKYWLLECVSKLNGFGEEVFSGYTHDHPAGRRERCEVSVGPHGIMVTRDEKHTSIPFSAASSATPSRSTFSLTYVSENGSVEELKLKLNRQRLSAGLYRAITEKHAFYSCETVCSDVTKQFIRDLKGTIASMFNVDTKLGKLYVFDIQRTCREVHDHARRVLHARGIQVRPEATGSADELSNEFDNLLRASGCGSAATGAIAVNAVQLEMDKEITCRIAEAFTCRVCMDSPIDTAFAPCGHVACCDDCAEKCKGICPLCRATIVTVNKVFLPSAMHCTASLNPTFDTNTATEDITMQTTG